MARSRGRIYFAPASNQKERGPAGPRPDGESNGATAGAQVPGTVDEVTKNLLRAIDQYFENE
ncbi:hypothetical protein [Pseudoflavonifractor phocaeensis]|uniref:hypothetical protein n=1 Tax=Pseudoflavonifractor phocaeensis TaxID=1870988 RepID=UPI00210DA5D6|nr:hypothetical protein [Pseudoflavonifractor phocaeensis]MCQ4866583.1 hypothetical protein [Pseudoflavonifractor phocaeensis]